MEKTFEELAQDPKGKIYVDAYENGVRYLIMRGGASLCAYVGIPKDHPLANRDSELIPLQVHGGLTFSGDSKHGVYPEGWYWYGWDYAHSGDSSFYDIEFGLKGGDIKWTVDMVKGEIWGATYEMSKLKSLAELIASHS